MISEANRPLGGAPTPSFQGASPSNKETTVSSMPPICPVCQEVATLWGRHEHNGVTEANYCCAQGHGWITKWVTP